MNIRAAWLLVCLGLVGCGVSDRPITQIPGVEAKAKSPKVIAQTQTEFPLYTIKPGSVYDGDTLRVLSPSGEIKIRFACIDAPEKNQDGGIEARDHLRSLLASAGNQVWVDERDTDRYGRTVAELWVDRGSGRELVQLAQVEAGLVWANDKYKSDCPSWDEIKPAEGVAQAGIVGIWDGDPLPPWVWRSQN